MLELSQTAQNWLSLGVVIFLVGMAGFAVWCCCAVASGPRESEQEVISEDLDLPHGRRPPKGVSPPTNPPPVSNQKHRRTYVDGG